MHAHNKIRIVIGNDYSNPSAFDLPKITPLPIGLSFFAEWIGNHEFGVRAAQLVQTQPVLGVLGETHALPRAEESRYLPSVAALLGTAIVGFEPQDRCSPTDGGSSQARLTPMLRSRPSILAAAPLPVPS
jgi:hypothetical protein